MFSDVLEFAEEQVEIERAAAQLPVQQYCSTRVFPLPFSPASPPRPDATQNRSQRHALLSPNRITPVRHSAIINTTLTVRFVIVRSTRGHIVTGGPRCRFVE